MLLINCSMSGFRNNINNNKAMHEIRYKDINVSIWYVGFYLIWTYFDLFRHFNLFQLISTYFNISTFQLISIYFEISSYSDVFRLLTHCRCFELDDDLPHFIEHIEPLVLCRVCGHQTDAQATVQHVLKQGKKRVMSHFKPHPILFCVLYTWIEHV